MKPKWLDKKESERKKADKKDRRYAKEIGGRAVGGSGSGWSHKGDIRVGNCLVERKNTSKKSMKVDEEFLIKIFRDATKAGKVPILILEYKKYRLVGKVEKI